MNYKELIDAIINEQANDAKEIVIAKLSEKIDVQLDEYYNYVTESIFGVERDAVEITEENFEEILNSLSEEDTKKLAEELEALEAQGLSEEELSEIVKQKISESFKSVENRIAKKEGISKDRAGAILANASRHASAKAKRENPKLNKVKG